MPITVESKPDQPLVIVHFRNPIEFIRDIPPFAVELKTLISESPEPVYAMFVTHNLKVDFGDLVVAMSMMTCGETKVMGHPNVARYFFVVDSDLPRLAVNALSQNQYGHLPVTVCKTEEEARALVSAALGAAEAIPG